MVTNDEFSADDRRCQCWWWMMISVLMMDDDVNAGAGWWCQCWWWMMMSVLMMDDDVSADFGLWCYADLCWYVGMLACWLMSSCWYRLERLNSLFSRSSRIICNISYSSLLYTNIYVPIVYICCLYVLYLIIFFFVLWKPLWIYVHDRYPFVLCNLCI